MKRLIFIVIYFLSTAVLADPVIIQKPILFDAKRIELTQEYRKQHYGIEKKSIVIIPQMIVLHWTAFDSFKDSYKMFYPAMIENRPDIVYASVLNTSAQFLVDKDGTIYQLMPSNWMARHVIGLNTIAIGIENVGGANGVQNLTEAQVKADVALVRYLVKKYPSIHYLIGHYEYGRFRDSPLWLEKDPNYMTRKVDPGPIFMQEVRKKVVDLGLKSQP